MTARISDDTSSVLLFDSEMITVWFHRDIKAVHHQMHRYTAGTTFHDALTVGAHALKEHGACKWLSDDRNNLALPLDHVKWADEVWAPTAIAAGWKYWALVQPKAAIGQLSIQRLIKLYSERGVEVRVFEEPSAGLAWLRAM